ERNRVRETGDALYDRLQSYDNKIKELQIAIELAGVERESKLEEIQTIQPYVFESTLTEASVPKDDVSLAVLLTSLQAAKEELARLRPTHQRYDEFKSKVEQIEGQIAKRTGGEGPSEVRTQVENPALAKAQEELDAIDAEIALQQ